MKKNGFTVVEMMAVLVILGLLIVIGIPAYIQVFNQLKRDNYNDKIRMIETAAIKYASSIKDEIKNAPNGCKVYKVVDLIENGYVESDGTVENYVTDPITGGRLEQNIYVCYSNSSYDLKAYYAKSFNANSDYYVNDLVFYEGDSEKSGFYRCVSDYPISNFNDFKKVALNSKIKVFSAKFMITDLGIDAKYKIWWNSTINENSIESDSDSKDPYKTESGPKIYSFFEKIEY